MFWDVKTAGLILTTLPYNAECSVINIRLALYIEYIPMHGKVLLTFNLKPIYP